MSEQARGAAPVAVGQQTEVAVLAGGCFWGVEEILRGVPGVLDTDVGYIELADTTREYELMAAAGLGWQQILASLTTHPARRFGHARHKGHIAAGKPTAFADVKVTIRAGKVIYQAAAAPARSRPRRRWSCPSTRPCSRS